jgi:hypothetical protein
LSFAIKAMTRSFVHGLLIDVLKAYHSVRWDKLKEKLKKMYSGRTMDILIIWVELYETL